MNLRLCIPLVLSVILGVTLTGCGHCGGPDGDSTACGSHVLYDDIEIRDRAVLPTLRISKELYTARAWRGATPTEPHTNLAIELSAAAASGSDSQSLAADEQVRIGKTTFLGPQPLKAEADLAMYDIAARWRQYFPRARFGYEVLAGVSETQLDVSVSSPTQRASERISDHDLRVGLGVLLHVLPTTNIEWRTSIWPFQYSWTYDGDFRVVARNELFLVQALGPHTTIRAGYAVWRAQSNRSEHEHSDVDFRILGPSVGLDVSF